ncbi:MAG: PilW family protein [Halothiobacillaceae bacterium]|nr:PilW family protein [Halothiobacillaceae bacterium]
MIPDTPRPHPYQTGFTLVEIMVGLAIGLLATIVILQVFSVFEAQKRSTTGTADAQTNGSIALYNIAREIPLAGYPLMPIADNALKCEPATTTYGATGLTGITPIVITDGTSDTITIRYGDSLMGGVTQPITGTSGVNEVTVQNSFGCLAGDVSLAINGTICALSTVSAVPGTTSVTLADTAAAVAGAQLACLGSNWNEITFAVNNATGKDAHLARNGTPIVAGIVNLQAQYGISIAPSSNQITEWVDASGGTWAAPTVNDRNRIKAIRIAVVARNAKSEPAILTNSCSSLNSGAPTGLCAWTGSASSPAPAIDLSADANWQHYRYRVFETIIPLRNVVWAKDKL